MTICVIRPQFSRNSYKLRLKSKDITFLEQCNGPSHVPFPVTPRDPRQPGEMLSDLMRCNFTNKMSDDLLRTLPHGPVFPTLQY